MTHNDDDDVVVVTAGQVVGGDFGSVLLRQKKGVTIEIGSLMISEEENSFLILQVFDMEYGSQIQAGMREMISGISMEQVDDVEFYEPEFVNYIMAKLKPLARVSKLDNKVVIPKSLPSFFSRLRMISRDDLEFLQKSQNSVFVGHIRSGTKKLDVPVWLPSQDIFSHHVLIPAATGRGKSNLVKCILWSMLDTNKVGALVLDAHDEYYGRSSGGGYGLKHHSNASNNLVYYTSSDPPPGAYDLVINLQSIKPEHLEGVVNFSDPQLQVMHVVFAKHKENWIEKILCLDVSNGNVETENLDKNVFKSSTVLVVQRRLRMLLGLRVSDGSKIISEYKVFDSTTKGKNTVRAMIDNIGCGRIVLLDTSRLGGETELIVGNIIADALLSKHRNEKARGTLNSRPVATIVIEEAPRVIGNDVLVSKDNIFSTIAKEGRKFKVGLVAITQLSSVIPRTILANMNTKIILGNEMKQEREAIIASSSQDLTGDDKNIASLDKGEALITSIFVPFALPIAIPIFDDLARKQKSQKPDRIKVH